MRFHFLLLTGLLLTASPMRPAIADAEGERAVLARIHHEIRALEPLLAEAASQADPDARIRFRYDWLRRDLDRMLRGLQAHIEAPQGTPRAFPALRGDYRR